MTGEVEKRWVLFSAAYRNARPCPATTAVVVQRSGTNTGALGWLGTEGVGVQVSTISRPLMSVPSLGWLLDRATSGPAVLD